MFAVELWKQAYPLEQEKRKQIVKELYEDNHQKLISSIPHLDWQSAKENDLLSRNQLFNIKRAENILK